MSLIIIWNGLKENLTRYFALLFQRSNDKANKFNNNNKQKNKLNRKWKGKQSSDNNSKNKTTLHQLNPQSKRGFKKRLQPKFATHNTNSGKRPLLGTTSSTSNTKQRKILKQFRGANSAVIKKLSTGRLAAYGLDKRKKRNSEAWF